MPSECIGCLALLAERYVLGVAGVVGLFISPEAACGVHRRAAQPLMGRQIRLPQGAAAVPRIKATEPMR